MTTKEKKPWPTKDVMNQIYDMSLWGGQEFDFYSGEGSHHPDIIQPYINAVTSFLSSFSKPLVICDLGCGDFNIGNHLVKYSKHYHAIDIVEHLIDRNKIKYQENNLEFLCLNIAKDELPAANCIILRQVLQHLSNTEIQNIVNKIRNYKYIILTEHIPVGDFIPNKDSITSQGIRLKYNSGVDLLKTPFNLKVKEEKTLDEFVLEHNKGRIVTSLYQMY